MIDDDFDDDLPPRDHNVPPTDAMLRTAELIKATNEAMASSAAIYDAETAGRYQGFVTQLRDAKADLEAEMKAAREPHDRAIAAIRARYADSIALIELARTKVQPRIDGWLALLQRRADDAKQRKVDAANEAQREADQLALLANKPDATIEQQLAAKRAQEEADKARYAANRTPKRAAIKGEWSPRAMTLKKYWAARIVDEDKAIRHFISEPTVRAAALGAILKLCRKLAVETKDAGQAPPGIEFTTTEKAQ